MYLCASSSKDSFLSFAWRFISSRYKGPSILSGMKKSFPKLAGSIGSIKPREARESLGVDEEEVVEVLVVVVVVVVVVDGLEENKRKRLRAFLLCPVVR